MDAKQIAADLERLRELAGLDREQLAEKMNGSPFTILHCEENERIPSMDVIEAWAAACGREVAVRFPKTDTATARLRDDLDATWDRLSDDDRELLVRFAKALTKADAGWKLVSASQVDAIVPPSRPRPQVDLPERLTEVEHWRRARTPTPVPARGRDEAVLDNIRRSAAARDEEEADPDEQDKSLLRRLGRFLG